MNMKDCWLKKLLFVMLFLFGNTIACMAANQSTDGAFSLLSPDGKVEAKVAASDSLQYSILMDGEIIITPSKLCMALADNLEIGNDVSLELDARAEVDDSWEAVAGPRKNIKNQYNMMVLNVREKANGLKYKLEFRAYDYGVAFRYIFDRNTNHSNWEINEELTEFNFEGDYKCWPLLLGSYTTMQETVYSECKLSDILPGAIAGLPFAIELGNKGYCSITEAALDNYAGAYITANSEQKELYRSPEIVGNGKGIFCKVDLPKDIGQIVLKVNSEGTIDHDHVDLANAKLVRADGSYVWLSDMKPGYVRQDWGQLQNDKSTDGNPLTIDGKRYEKGLGTHANAVIVFECEEDFVRFETTAGIDSEVGDKGKATISVSANTASESKYSLRTSLSRVGRQGSVVNVKSSGSSPWRVVMLGRKAIDMVDSDIIVNLNEPSKISDTSWIKPSVASWNWLTTFHALNTKVIKEFIDLSAEMDWKYALIDDGWYKDGNCTTSQNHLNIPELVKYAEQKGVKVWLWVHWESLNARMEEAMSLYEDWGVVGIKVDFMSRDDQWMVDWYHKVLEKAASHKLMVNFHGCYKPTGIRRTWPNLMTREAVYGLEQNFSNKNDPVHKTILPFTRMLAGPMDYTPGSFRNKTKDTWRGTTPVSTLGTRCQELAICLIYDSPVLNMADSYSSYIGKPGSKFLKGLPTSWVETKIIDGEIGKYFVSARYDGKSWYVGGITNWDERKMKVALDFLDENVTYTVTLYEDGPKAFDDDACDIKSSTFAVDSTGVLTTNMASGGGFVAKISKSE